MSVTPDKVLPGLGSPPGRSGSGTTRPGRRGPDEPIAAQARIGGNRCRGGRSGMPGSLRTTRALARARTSVAGSAFSSPRAQAISEAQVCAHVSQRRSTGSDSSTLSVASPASAASAARAWPRARADVSSPAVPTVPGCAESSRAGPASRSDPVHLNAAQDHFTRARCLQRGEVERRLDGKARPIRGQGDQDLPVVVQERRR